MQFVYWHIIFLAYVIAMKNAHKNMVAFRNTIFLAHIMLDGNTPTHKAG